MNSVETITLFKLCHKHLFFVIEISNNLFKYCVIKLIFGFKKYYINTIKSIITEVIFGKLVNHEQRHSQ